MAYAYFDNSGKLLSLASKQSDFPDALEFEVTNVTNPNGIYLDLESMTVKDRDELAVTVSYNLIAGLPVGTQVLCSEGTFVVDDGSIEFDANVAETLTVYLDHPHYIGKYVEVPTGPEGDA